MRDIQRSALVPYTAEQMFALVADFETYPQFVPWVASTSILERGPNLVVGRLEMQRSGLREQFTTRTALLPPNAITLSLIDGPFRTFEGRWGFQPLGGRGSQVSLHVQFELKNPMVGLLLARTLEKSCSELVDAFVARARALYGSAAS